ncbi:MAG: hypothetical protein OQL08_05210 [Gammaproteobacteria bacterium]|nr:hypothetical protein [Gammaproteobacteria bacterium]
MIEQLETALWQQPDNAQRLAVYQQQFRELERQRPGDEPCHHFIIVIPVADRPQQLAACLGSILTLCDTFGYGGKEAGRYRMVEVLIADDSKASDNIERHRQIAADYDQRGLTCHYFGQHEQLAQLDRLDSASRSGLMPIIGDTPVSAFYHKGASLMRNIAYLKLNEMVAGRDDILIYFIDSDQEFQVKVATPSGERNLYAINYLYQLDRIFSERDVAILTGKVVGDPPVSPAVMAGRFLADVSTFLGAMAHTMASIPCHFHGTPRQSCDDAAYHDMADLFGFKTRGGTFDYRCTLAGDHDHAACLTDFAAQLNRFFDGEHPTRKSYYEHRPLAESITPARTVYTGNYCFRATALRYFIPFATLKLRMAGPVLGRIIKAELGDKFVSANLPMLHKRTVEETGQSEFRPGIEREQHTVDLCGEFERQFFGDVMLFSMERLTAQGYPATVLSAAEVEALVQQVETEMLHNYTTRHGEIMQQIAALRALFEGRDQWWQQGEALVATREQFQRFITNMEDNFGDDAAGYRQIRSSAHRARRRQQIVGALLSYQDDRVRWEGVLASGTNP